MSIIQSCDDTIPLVIKTRTPLVECCYRGFFCIVDRSGHVISSGGNVSHQIFMRSCAKPFQALPLIEARLHEKYGLESGEIALIVASHSGQDIHLAIGRTLLTKLGLTDDMLMCGLQYPLDENAKNKLILLRQTPTVLHNNCSGKHIGMLALTKENGWPCGDYLRFEHPVQQRIYSTILELLALNASSVTLGIDGCGVPTYGIPIWKLAYGFAILGTRDTRALVVIRHAMADNPSIIAGTGYLETELGKRLGRNIVLKRGAEGLLGISVPELGFGIVIKNEVGLHSVSNIVAMDILHQLGVVDASILGDMEQFSSPLVKDLHGNVVGSYRSLIRNIL